MENEIREDLVMIFLGWFISGTICVITLIGLYDNKWNIELTMVLLIDFGILAFLAILLSVITFLYRFKIVRK